VRQVGLPAGWLGSRRLLADICAVHSESAACSDAMLWRVATVLVRRRRLRPGLLHQSGSRVTFTYSGDANNAPSSTTVNVTIE